MARNTSKAAFLSAAGFFCLLLMAHGVTAQDPKRQYKNAKEFFVERKYNLAMESFKPLLTYDKDNPYTEYACFYYAQSALRQNYLAVARDMFLQIKKLYPAWDQMNEVNYWLAKIYFDQREYFQAMYILKDVRQEDFIEAQEISRLKRHYLSQITDTEVLSMMLEEYPQDPDVGKSLARSITHQPYAQQDRVLLDSVIHRFSLPPDQYVSSSALPPVYKDHYTVSVLFPFLTATLEPSPNKKQNQLVLDLYEGMRMANDSLARQGIKIELRAYDTERNPADPEHSKRVIGKLLETDELKNTDLIVGPLFREDDKLVQQFSEKHMVNMINPVSSNSEYAGQNPHAMLFQPSNETSGARSAELLARRIKNRNCMILYGEAAKDSLLAVSFSIRAKELGLNIVWAEEFKKETAARIISILATPTEFDEFKNPTQFKMKLDSIGSIFVASDNPLIYTKVISSVESRGDSVVLVGSEVWLDNPSVDLTKYERLHIMLAAPNYTPLKLTTFVEFRKRYIRTHGSFPPEYMNYTKLGYDFMVFIGQAMKKYGVYFQEGLIDAPLMPGWLSRGYKISPARDNQEVQFVYFRNGELIPVE